MKRSESRWWNRKGASTLEYVVIIAVAAVLGIALYNFLAGDKVQGTLMKKIEAAIQGKVTGGEEKTAQEGPPGRKSEDPRKAPPPPPKQDESMAEKVGKGVLDFAG